MKNILYYHSNILRKCLLMYENVDYNLVMNIHQKMIFQIFMKFYEYSSKNDISNFHEVL